MSDRPRRLRFLVLILAMVASAHAIPVAAEAATGIDRGVVQQVMEKRLVLRALDGSVHAFTVDARTRVFLDGRLSRLRSVRPGFVAEVRGTAAAEAVVVRAFAGRRAVVEGIVLSSSRSSVTLRLRAGGFEQVPLTRTTRFRLGHADASPQALSAGRRVRVFRGASAGARLVVIRARGRG